MNVIYDILQGNPNNDIIITCTFLILHNLQVMHAKIVWNLFLFEKNVWSIKYQVDMILKQYIIHMLLPIATYG
jgi:hypothetical protein